MIRTAALSFVALAAVLAPLGAASAQVYPQGEQCRPAGANLSQVRDCRIHTVGTKQSCRCVVMPGFDEAARKGAATEVAASDRTLIQ